jgi:hypothetical protein
MKQLGLILVILGLLPAAGSAETTLYACTRNGQTTLESVKSNDCDTLKVYHYQSYAKDPQQNQSLAKSNPTSPPLDVQIRRYENVDERVGWALANGYMDSRQERCHYYQAILSRALAYIHVKDAQDIEIGPTDSANLRVQIDYAQDQIDTFCGN